MARVGQGEPRTHGGVGGGQREYGAAGLECLRLLQEFVVGDGRDFGRAGNIQGGHYPGCWGLRMGGVDLLGPLFPAFNHCLPCCTPN